MRPRCKLPTALAYVIDMLDEGALRGLIEQLQPDLIVPEIEAIATPVLVELEAQGQRVAPTATAARLTMDRQGIRELAAETLQVPTSPYRFAATREEYLQAIDVVGLPCVVKPVMSSSGKGQSTLHSKADVDPAHGNTHRRCPGSAGMLIVGGFVDFDYEITLLTVRHCDGTSFCDPIGHRQEGGDYQESWQPQPHDFGGIGKVSAHCRTGNHCQLGWLGFVWCGVLHQRRCGVFFRSPRPHDTGMVTMISQDLVNSLYTCGPF